MESQPNAKHFPAYDIAQVADVLQNFGIYMTVKDLNKPTVGSFFVFMLSFLSKIKNFL